MSLELLKSYNFPFKQTDAVLEIGGGLKPYFRPNMDARKLETVDIVHNFNDLPLPVKSEQCDGVVQIYSIEHISWRKWSAYMSEILRILKPGGVFVALTANLYEQAKMIAEAGDEGFTQDMSTMIFGDQDEQGSGSSWVFNSHYIGWSPSWLAKRLKEIGFYKVEMWSYPIKTDMIVHAHKSKAVIF